MRLLQTSFGLPQLDHLGCLLDFEYVKGIVSASIRIIDAYSAPCFSKMGHIVGPILNVAVGITPSIFTGRNRGLVFTCVALSSSSNTAKKRRIPAVDVRDKDWSFRQERSVCWQASTYDGEPIFYACPYDIAVWGD